MVDQREVVAMRHDLLQQRFDELVEVIDLLQFAPAVLVEPAVTRQDMQFLEQFDRLLRPDLGDATHL